MNASSFFIAALAASSACASATDTAARKAFERFADLAVELPPVCRVTDLDAYSTNRLAFALNNGLAMTRGGRIWASWISGGDGPASFTAAAWSDDRGETWSDTALVIDGHDGTIAGRTNIIGTFWLAPDGSFRCYTDQSILHFDGRAGVWEAVCANPDAPDPKWSAFRRICDGHLMNKPIVLKNGDWAASAYLNGTWRGPGSFLGAFPSMDAKRGAICLVSRDRGRTWEERGVTRFPAETREEGPVEDWQESQLVESSDAKILRVFARVIDGARGRLMAAESRDGGFVWTKAHDLPGMDNTNARFQILRLASGRLLFVKHGKPDRGAERWRGRTALTAWLSDDEGYTWKGGLLLDPGNGSYPDAFQAPDGTIFVSHDHGRGREAEIRLHRFTEEDVLAGRVVSANGRLNMLVMRAMATSFNRARFAKK